VKGASGRATWAGQLIALYDDNHITIDATPCVLHRGRAQAHEATAGTCSTWPIGTADDVAASPQAIEAAKPSNRQAQPESR